MYFVGYHEVFFRVEVDFLGDFACGSSSLLIYIGVSLCVIREGRPCEELPSNFSFRLKDLKFEGMRGVKCFGFIRRYVVHARRELLASLLSWPICFKVIMGGGDGGFPWACFCYLLAVEMFFCHVFIRGSLSWMAL